MLRRVLANSLRRTLTNRRHFSDVYDGDARTTVSLLHQDRPDVLCIKAYTHYGFRLSDESFVMGPIIMFPRTLLHWNIAKPEDVTVDSLIIFSKLEPKPNIVVIGHGARGSMKLSPEIRKYFVDNKIGIEFLATPDAIATFNYLNADSRLVAGAFMPLVSLRADTEQYVKITETKRRLLLDD